MRKLDRCLAVVLAALMLLTSCPVTAFAAEDTADESTVFVEEPIEAAGEAAEEITETSMEEVAEEPTEEVVEEVAEETAEEAADALASGDCGDGLTWVLSADGILTIRGEGPMADYTAANRQPWSSCRSSITALVVEDGVTTIGEYAFAVCSNLTEMTLPDSIEAIGGYAFYDCRGLAAVELPENLVSIGDYAFYYCSALAGELVIPDSVVCIGNYAFRDCRKVTTLTLGSSLETIGDYAFYYCSVLTGDLVIPDSVVSIGSAAFGSCKFTGTLTLGSSLETIGKNTFAYAGFTGALVLPDSLVTIGSSAFQNCSKLTSLVFGNGLETIGDSAFSSCSGLTGALTFPDSVVSIGASAFYNCKKLSGTVTLPDSLEEFDNPFAGCTEISAFEISEEADHFATQGGVLFNKALTVAVRAPQGLTALPALPETLTEIGNYAFAACQKLTGTLDLPAGIIRLGTNAFYGCSRLTGSVVLTEGAEYIGDYAFNGCTGLNGTLVIPDTVTYIGTYAFYNCQSLTGELTLPRGLTQIPSYCFYNCQKLTGSLNIPEGVTSVGSYAFQSCVKLDGTVTLPEGLKTVQGYAFYGCQNLTGDLILPQSLTSIGGYAFYNCRNMTGTLRINSALTSIGNVALQDCGFSELELAEGNTKFSVYSGILYNAAQTTLIFAPSDLSGSVDFPKTLTTIPASTFKNRQKITHVTVGDQITSLGANAFENCTALVSAELGSGIKYVNSSLFLGCTALETVTIPDTATAIYSRAFDGCTSLKQIDFPSTLTRIDDYAFQNCADLTGELVVPDSTTYLGYYAFLGCTSLQKVTLGSGIKELSQHSFKDCTGLEEVVFSAGTKIKTSAFQNCTALHTVDLGTVTTIETDAFRDCTALQNIDLSAVTSLASAAFYGCTSLQSIDLSAMTGTVSSNAFYGCTGLTSIDLGSATYISDRTFYGCTGLQTVHIPATVTSIGQMAFEGCTNLIFAYFAGNAPKFYVSATYSTRCFPRTTVLVCTPEATGWTNSSYYNATKQTWRDYLFSVGTSESAVSGTCGENLTWGLSNEGVLTITGEGTMTAFTSTADVPWYAYRAAIKALSLPETLTEIPAYAFSGCTGLTGELTIPDAVGAIGDHAFDGCTGLTALHLGKELASVTAQTFSGCTNVETLTVNAENPYISVKDQMLFSKDLTELIYVLRTKTGELTIPESVTQIKVSAAEGCSGLAGELTLPKNLTVIGNDAFSGCTALTGKLDLPTGLTAIGDRAFYGCSGLTGELSIYGGVTTIGASAFLGCTGLAQDITFTGDAPAVTAKGSNGSFESTVILHCRADAAGWANSSNYNAAAGTWNGYTLIAPGALVDSGTCGESLTWRLDTDGVLTIEGTGVMVNTAGNTSPWNKYRTAIKKVVLPAGLTTICNYAFSSFTALREIQIPSTVSSIGKYAFSNCSAMAMPQLPEGLTSLGESAFSGCVSMKGTLSLPVGIKYLEDYVFQNCAGLTGILVLPEGMYRIGDYAFSGCSGLTALSLPDSVTDIYEHAFDGCAGLTGTMKLPKKLGYVYSNSFINCSGITAFEVAADNSAFMTVSGVLYNKSGTTLYCVPQAKQGRLEILDTVTYISAYAAYNCTGLTGSLTIPDGVTSIGNYAFCNCAGLTGTLTLPASLRYVNARAFQNCTGFTGRLVIPAAMYDLSEFAFQNCSGINAVYFEGNAPALEVGTRRTFDSGLPFYCRPDATGWMDSSYYDAAKQTWRGHPLSLWLQELGSGTCGDGLSWILSDDGTLTIEGSGAMTNYTPEAAAPWAEHADKITALAIGDGVTDLGDYAFCGTALTGTVEIPSNVASIGSGAFMDTAAEAFHFSGNAPAVIAAGEEGASFESTVTLHSEPGTTGWNDGEYYDAAQKTWHGYALEINCLHEETAPRYSWNGDKTHTVSNHCAACGEFLSSASASCADTDGDMACDLCQGDMNVLSSGTCGEDLRWTLTADGTLTIEGTGDMANYSTYGAPWYSNRTKIKTIVLPEGLTSIGGSAFNNCSNVTAVPVLPEGLTSIGYGAFSGCSGMTGTLTLPASLKMISSYAFQNCSGLTGKLTVPAGLKLDNGVFSGCTGLTEASVDAPLPQYLFSGCTGLKKLELGANATSPAHNSLKNCTGLETITVAENNPDLCTDDGVLYNKTKTILYRCPAKKIGTLTIPETVTMISDEAAKGCAGLTGALVLPEGLKSVGTDAFSGCASLTGSLRIPAAVTKLGDNAFLGCTGLTEVRFNAAPPAMSGAASAAPTFPAELVLCYPFHTEGWIDSSNYDAEAKTYLGYALRPWLDGTELDLFTDFEANRLGMGCSTVYGCIYGSAEVEKAELFYVSGGRRVPMGEVQLREDLSDDFQTVYAVSWDISALEEGQYEAVWKLTQKDGTELEHTETVYVKLRAPKAIEDLIAIGDLTVVRLSWSIASEIDTTGYRLYRRAADQETFTLLATLDGRDTLSYVDATVAEDEIYYYYIAGVDDIGQEGAPSGTVGATLSEDTEPPLVTGLSPKSYSYLNGTEIISMTSRDDLCVVRSELYTSTDGGETWSLFAEGTAASLAAQFDTTAAADGDIRFKGVAWDAAGNEGSSVVYVYRIDNTPPAQVREITAEVTSVTAALHWPAPAEDEEVVSYLVYRKQEDGTYAVIKQVSALGCNLTGLLPDTEYIYRVTAVDARGNESEPSADAVIRTMSDTTPPVVTQLRPLPGYFNETIPVSASASDEYCVVSMTLQVSGDAANWTDVHTVSFGGVSKTRTLTYDLALDGYAEGSLYIRAIAKDAAGNESDWSINAPYVQHMVDRTAPAAPTDVAADGSCGFVEVSWVQGEETDLNGYTVYRAAADGQYEKMAEVQALNWFDRTAEEDIVYSYKVTARDLAGNESDSSEAVSARMIPDDEAPVIVNMYPEAGSTLGTGFRTISVLATDNSRLESVSVHYSKNGTDWTLLTQENGIGDYGTTCRAALPEGLFTHGQTISIRAAASDRKGNVSEALVQQYVWDAQAPSISSLQVTVNESGRAVVSWQSLQEQDLSGYYIYRKIGKDGAYTLIATRSADQTLYTCEDYTLTEQGVTCYYKIEAADLWGNKAQAVTEGIYISASGEAGVPTAVLQCESVMQKNVEYYIDGSASTDDVQIVSYTYDFGDGTTAQGKRVIHSYAEEGEYTIRLTVTDAEGNEAAAEKTVTVGSRASVGTVRLLVVDQYNTPVANAPVHFDAGTQEEYIKTTDASGYATFTAKAGVHHVVCLIADNNWLPGSRDVIVMAGTENYATLTMVQDTMISGEFEVTPMTLEEIKAAGIDIANPENHHLIRMDIAVVYGEEEIRTQYIYNGYTGKIINPEPIEAGERVLVPTVLRPEADASAPLNDHRCAVALLDLPVSASYLKEMFDVKLHILNNAGEEYAMVDNYVTLNLPEGLSLVESEDDSHSNTLQVYAERIPGQSQQTFAWYVRGDTEGEYALTADYMGRVENLTDAIIRARFETEEPLTVYGLSNMRLIVDLNETINYDGFYFDLSLENTGAVDVNLPSIGVMEDAITSYLKLPVEGAGDGPMTDEELAEIMRDTLQARGVSVRKLNTFYKDRYGDGRYLGAGAEVEVLAPGETVTNKYVAYNAAGFNNTMYFYSAIAKIREGYGIDVQINLKDLELFDMDNAMEKMQQAQSDPEKRRSMDMILDGAQYFYVEQALEDSNYKHDFQNYKEGTFTPAQRLPGWESSHSDAETAQLTRALVAELLRDEAMEQAVEVNLNDRYNVLGRQLLQKLTELLRQHGAEEDDVQIMTAWLSNAKQCYALTAALRNNGIDGFLIRLQQTMADAGVTEHSRTLLLDLDEDGSVGQTYTASLNDVCGTLDPDAIGGKLTQENLSAEMALNLLTIAAAREEAYALLDLLIAGVTDGAIARALGEMRLALDDTLAMQDAQLNRKLEDVSDTLAADALLLILGSCCGDSCSNAIRSLANGTAGAQAHTFGTGSAQRSLYEMQINLILSEALCRTVTETNRVFVDNEEAAHTLRAMKYLIKLRLIGEKTLVRTRQQLDTQEELLQTINSRLSTSYTDLEQYLSAVFTQLLSFRDNLFATYYKDAELADAPTVNLDVPGASTDESFEEDFEYSYDGLAWIPCDGSAIPVIPGSAAKILWVRQGRSGDAAGGNIAKVIIPAKSRIRGEVTASFAGEHYTITGLKAGSYTYTFTNETAQPEPAAAFMMLRGADNALQAEAFSLQTAGEESSALTGTFIAENDTPVILEQPEAYTYLALVLHGDEENFESDVRYIETSGKDEGTESVKVNVAGSNMTLGNELKVNIMVKTADMAGGTYTVRIRQENQNPVELELARYNNTYHNVAWGIAAKEMADDLYVEILDADGNVVSEPYTTSARDYAGKALKSETATTYSRTMVVDMLNYGASAQQKLNYNVEDLANNQLTEEQKAMASDPVACENKQVKGKNCYGSNLTLDESILLNVFFSGLKNADISSMHATIEFTGYRGAENRIEVPGSELVMYNQDVYKVVVDDIVLSDARQLITVKLYNADGTLYGEAVDSVESYVVRAIAAGKNETGLFTNIMKFAMSAQAYLLNRN